MDDDSSNLRGTLEKVNIHSRKNAEHSIDEDSDGQGVAMGDVAMKEARKNARILAVVPNLPRCLVDLMSWNESCSLSNTNDTKTLRNFVGRSPYSKPICMHTLRRSEEGFVLRLSYYSCRVERYQEVKLK